MAVERSMQNLFHKAGDTALRCRDDSKNFIMEMANFSEVKVCREVKSSNACAEVFHGKTKIKQIHTLLVL